MSIEDSDHTKDVLDGNALGSTRVDNQGLSKEYLEITRPTPQNTPTKDLQVNPLMGTIDVTNPDGSVVHFDPHTKKIRSVDLWDSQGTQFHWDHDSSGELASGFEKHADGTEALYSQYDREIKAFRSLVVEKPNGMVEYWEYDQSTRDYTQIQPIPGL